MTFQINLNNELVKPWKNRCCKACYTAKEERCTCRCGGVFHGIGSGMQPRRKRGNFNLGEILDQVLTPEQEQKFWPQIKEKTCHWCDATLEGQPIQYYEHNSGWIVTGLSKKQWLYIVCPNCKYQWALWKLGVMRG